MVFLVVLYTPSWKQLEVVVALTVFNITTSYPLQSFFGVLFVRRKI